MAETSLLLIDDDPSVHDLADFHLEGLAGRLLHAFDGEQGVAVAESEQPTVILLDIVMPDASGYDVCRRLKENDRTRDIPVIFLTADRSLERLAEALDLGGSDYVTKPFAPVELRARIRVAMRTRRMIEMLRIHARIDALTGLVNRGAFDDAIGRAEATFLRDGTPYAVVMFDADHFKRVNDTWGHGVGDEVLRRLGETIAAGCRRSDVAARYGGEEFAVILNRAETGQALQTTRRILGAVRRIEVPVHDGVLQVTCSAGVAVAGVGDTAAEVVARADRALYRAKQEGRDRLALEDEPADATLPG
jgi:two-component system cell cycle response regulator